MKNKKLLTVNINGVLYRSTSNKLEKTQLVTPQKKKALGTQNEKTLLIRGQKFVLDPSGTKLERDNETSNATLSRIDIGGLTYKKKASDGAYERDNSHQVRNHLTVAKTKSISMLQRGKLQITNVICPIYRRLGKCLSYSNGRCPKIHDARYVIVCPNFIKGKCENEKCLLSHNANLHKMPVCKYYLKGQCVKSMDECLYLHKKLTDGTKLCTEFVKGYCQLADKVRDIGCMCFKEFRHFKLFRYFVFQKFHFVNLNFEKPLTFVQVQFTPRLSRHWQQGDEVLVREEEDR